MISKYIFFDFDGTISDACSLTYEVLGNIFDKHEFKYSKKKLHGLMGSKMQIILKDLGIDRRKVNEIRRMFYDSLVEPFYLKKLKLCVSVNPLWDLKKEGYKLIIVSNSEKKFLKASIKQLGLNGLFYRAYGADGFITKDIILRKLLRLYHLRGGKTVFVGDRFSDITFAHRAKMIGVAIHNKCAWSSLKRVLREDPDYIIEDFKGLKKIIEKEKKI